MCCLAIYTFAWFAELRTTLEGAFKTGVEGPPRPSSVLAKPETYGSHLKMSCSPRTGSRACLLAHTIYLQDDHKF